FTRYEPPPAPDIYAMKADGSGQTALNNHPALDLGPAWSPSGARIAFARAGSTGGDIFVMNTDGSGQTALTDDPALDDSAPAWSPDSTHIAFTRWTGSSLGEIYVMDADGG